MKKIEPCPQGLKWRDWRQFLALIEHHKSIAQKKRIEHDKKK